MSSSITLASKKREKVGSRAARQLRNEGRVPASIQGDKDHPHVDLSMDEVEFLTARRKHVHLFDLDMGGQTETAVIRELQWDSMGDRILHVEFKRVVRGVATEAEVELRFLGQVTEGLLTHSVSHITISCMPSMIPDEIEVKVGKMKIGDHLKASDLELPEGATLAVDPDLEIAVLSAPQVQAEESGEEGEGEDAAE